MEELEDALKTYPWKCAECKSCEICEEKDGDVRPVMTNLVLCILIVRYRAICLYVMLVIEVSLPSVVAPLCSLPRIAGWHMGCLQPPLTEEPPGKWYCPKCPIPQEPLPQAEFSESEQQLSAEPNIDPDLLAADERLISPVENHRESSVASSSRSAVAPTKTRRKGKGKASAPVPATDESELEVDTNVNGVEEEQTPITASRRRNRVKSRWKGKQPAKNGDESGVETQTDHENPQPPPIKRIRLLHPSPHPAVRIKILPPKGKGKEREHDSGEDGEDGVKKGMFDDFLSPEDRDTGQTSIMQGDKTRFEKARAVGDVSRNPYIET